MRRRDFLQLGAAAALTGCARPKVLAPAAPLLDETTGPGSLKAHAAAKGFLSGCAVDIALLQRDASYARLVREQASIIVGENTMKWAPLRPAPDAFSFEQADALVAFAEQNRMKVRGHNLCWHRQLPAWFAGYATPANASDLLRAHIEKVAGRYAGRMHSWDVVNEAVFLGDGRPDGLRESPWLQLAGESYIELAYRAAREADPQALLVYNDYGMEGEDEGSRRKRAAVLLLLRRLRTRNVPLDGVGIQAHLSAGGTYGAGMRDFIQQARELQLQVMITEMDVNDRSLPAQISQRDAEVASAYRSYLDLVLRDPAVRVVVTWGITDRKTWLNSEDSRADHLPERCLPFGVVGGLNDAPKPAFYAIRAAFDGRPPA